MGQQLHLLGTASAAGVTMLKLYRLLTDPISPGIATLIGYAFWMFAIYITLRMLFS